MDVTQPGLVLKTEYYADCVAFYRDTLGLPVLFSEDHGSWGLTCLKWGAGYIMVETGGVAAAPEKSFAQAPMKIRFNVGDLDAEVAALQAKGIDIKVAEHEWGRVAECCDPDGNRIALRPSEAIYRTGHA